MNEAKRIFGIRHVGFFVATLIMENDGFVYKGHKYGWNDIITMKRSDTFADNLGRFPSTTVLLSDGNIIRLPITLEEKNIKEKSNFFDWCDKSEAYKYVVSLFENKIYQSKSKYADYLYSSNQIMFYRMGIIVGLCFNLMALLVIFGFGAKFNSSMLFPICSGFVLTIIGICLAAKRRRDESFIMKELNKVEKRGSTCAQTLTGHETARQVKRGPVE